MSRATIVERRGSPTLAELVIESLFRAFIVVGVSVFVLSAIAAYQRSPSVPLILLAVSEVVTILLVLFARTATLRDCRPWAVLTSIGATFYFLFIELTPGTRLLPESICTLLQCIGIIGAIWAKLSLGRSFGLLPANRGVVAVGPYRYIRHPIYVSYFIAHMGFLAHAFSIQNALTFALLYALQLARVRNEERILQDDSAYRAYARQVRWRCVPRVF